MKCEMEKFNLLMQKPKWFGCSMSGMPKGHPTGNSQNC